MVTRRFVFSLTLVAAHVAAAGTLRAQASAAPTANVVALRGGTVHTAAGSVIRNGTVVIRDGKIAEVGADVAVPAGARVVDLSGKEVIPGMIDNHSHIGAARKTSMNRRSHSALNIEWSMRSIRMIEAGSQRRRLASPPSSPAPAVAKSRAAKRLS